MDHHNYMLDLFESFQQHQDQLEATNLLKLKAMEPATRYYVEAKLDGKLEWTEWAYTRHERDQLVQDAKDAGFSCTVEEYD
jgi:hypothetical protein